MTTNAIHALPGEVQFHVEVMRQEMKAIKTSPREEGAAAIEKMEEEINLLFENRAAAETAAEKDKGSTALSRPVSSRIGFLGGQPPPRSCIKAPM
jgi:hypothetical protein